MKQVGWVTNETPGDWSKVSKEAPAALEPGLYRARFKSAKPAPTRRENKPAIALELSIFEDGAGNAIEPTRKATDTLVLTTASKWRQKMVCEALGLDVETTITGYDVEDAEDICAELLEKGADGFYVKMKQRKYRVDGEDEDRTTHEVDRYLTPDEASGATTAAASNGAGETPRRRRRNNAAATNSVS